VPRLDNWSGPQLSRRLSAGPVSAVGRIAWNPHSPKPKADCSTCASPSRRLDDAVRCSSFAQDGSRSTPSNDVLPWKLARSRESPVLWFDRVGLHASFQCRQRVFRNRRHFAFALQVCGIRAARLLVRGSTNCSRSKRVARGLIWTTCSTGGKSPVDLARLPSPTLPPRRRRLHHERHSRGEEILTTAFATDAAFHRHGMSRAVNLLRDCSLHSRGHSGTMPAR